MKVSRYAVLAFATATVFGMAMAPVMAQDTTPQSTQDASKDAMKSSSDAMKSSSDAMKSSSDSMKSDATQSTQHKKQHKSKKSGAPASSSSAGH
ncbi:hypothetical protein [Dyella sp. C11]|uniref:hypothetical protein n=1 Tax=Dyella sp. C11 TaxID=2126991 RepID=UPI000D651EC4|nr:hypothetical protein [Dyella sp. C11]